MILDRDLAELYGVETKVLKQAVRRNAKRFPVDFMFELKKEEEKTLRSQSVTLKRGKHSKYLSFAFTEQGVAMLSSVLNSDRAIQVNIQIMRAFSKLREMLSTHEDLKEKMETMEKKYDQQFQVIFEAIKQLLETEAKPKKRIGTFFCRNAKHAPHQRPVVLPKGRCWADVRAPRVKLTPFPLQSA